VQILLGLRADFSYLLIMRSLIERENVSNIIAEGRGGPPFFPQEYDFNIFILRILQEYDSTMVMIHRRNLQDSAVPSDAGPGGVT
jgi:hypothetical protein